MSDDNRFSVSISSDLPADERETLLLALRTHADLQETEPRDPVTIALTVVAIMKGVGAVAGGVTAAAGATKAVMELAEKINEWRHGVRARGGSPNARLERPGRPPIDLATASDQEVLEWLLGKRSSQ